MVARKIWNVHEPDRDSLESFARELGCSETLASLLLRRGIELPEDATSFLEPKLHDLAEPDALPDIDRAVERIGTAIQKRERVVIFGDYDVDGISSTCLLLDAFRLFEFSVRHRLPDRLKDGYGLRVSVVEEIAEEGADLIITVDNGSSARAEVERARELGIDVVVIDHHQPGEQLPEPVAFVNPWLDEKAAAFTSLAGVGVTFKVVWALCQWISKAKKLSDRFRNFLVDALAFVALGTVADVVPLRGENRVLTKFGLRALQSSARPGVRALVDLSLQNARPDTRLEASHIGFRMGPRINAVGRLGRADEAVELLMTDCDEDASRLVNILDRENQRRRTIEAEIVEMARQRVLDEYDLDVDRCIVLGDEGWHPGVIGIVASRLVDEFFRPVLLFALEGDRGRGSARSIPQVHIHRAMTCCSDHFVQFGGHALAAGAEIERDRLPELRTALHEAIETDVSEMRPAVDVDCHLPLSAIGSELLHEISKLQPYGEGNPEPLFAATGLEIAGQPRLMGQDGKHLSFHVKQPGGTAFRAVAFRAVAFGMGKRYPEIEKRGTEVSLLFRPQWNEWQGRRSIELHVQDLRVAGES